MAIANPCVAGKAAFAGNGSSPKRSKTPSNPNPPIDSMILAQRDVIPCGNAPGQLDPARHSSPSRTIGFASPGFSAFNSYVMPPIDFAPSQLV